MAAFNHIAHPRHSLAWTAPHPSITCSGCNLPMTGEVGMYGCATCGFYLHHRCATAPPVASIPTHSQHPVALRYQEPNALSRGLWCECDVCERSISSGLYYRCSRCDFDAHLFCATATGQLSQPRSTTFAPPVYNLRSTRPPTSAPVASTVHPFIRPPAPHPVATTVRPSIRPAPSTNVSPAASTPVAGRVGSSATAPWMDRLNTYTAVADAASSTLGVVRGVNWLSEQTTGVGISNVFHATRDAPHSGMESDSVGGIYNAWNGTGTTCDSLGDASDAEVDATSVDEYIEDGGGGEGWSGMLDLFSGLLS